MRRHLTRRDFTASLAAVAATGCAHHIAPTPPPPPAPPDITTLRGAASSRGLLAGAAVNVGALRRDIRYAALLAAECNIVVAENEMKFAATEPQPGVFTFDDAEFLATFAAQNGMKLRGHNLVWHDAETDWLKRDLTPANAAQILTRHIEGVAGHFAGRIHSWDVVNEAIEPGDKLPGGLRASLWQRNLPGYIDLAFQTARAADPHALLCYNDYGIEAEDDGSARKRDAVLALVRGMQDRRVPIDAVGIQSHLVVNETCGNGLLSFIAELHSMGLKVLLTEMDVNDRALPADISTRDTAVAGTYANYLNAVLASPAVIALLTWGLTDRYTWLNYFLKRDDGQSSRSLPFDAGLQPKPAFSAELNALLNAPAR